MNRKDLKLVVRLTHNNYIQNNNLVSKSSLTLMKRKSTGILSDLIQDPDYDLPRLDLKKYESGIYLLTTKNESYDIESGYADDWDLDLIPYEAKGMEMMQ